MLSLLLHFLSDETSLCLLTCCRGPFVTQLVCVWIPTNASQVRNRHLRSGMRVRPWSSQRFIRYGSTQRQIYTKKSHYFLSPSVWPSLERPPLPSSHLPFSKRHFCNSMQESELCQKVLASLKADLPFKADASAMGSTFPSAGSRNETFSRVCSGAFLWTNKLWWNRYLVHEDREPSGGMGWKNSFRSWAFLMILVSCFYSGTSQK